MARQDLELRLVTVVDGLVEGGEQGWGCYVCGMKMYT